MLDHIAPTVIVDPPAPSYTCDTEWQARCDLAACYRLMAHFGMQDTIYGHATVRVPGSPGEFLINPYGQLYDEITASSLVKIDHEGRALSHSAPVNAAGFVIHSAIHMARPDTHCVIHTHTRAGVAVSCLEEGILPINQFALEFLHNVAYHDYEGIALDLDERDRLVSDMGEANALVLRNHGMLTAGSTIPAAFQLFFYLEQTCKVQLDVMASGGKIKQVPKDVQEHTFAQYASSSNPASAGVRSWPAMLRLLQRVNPGWDV